MEAEYRKALRETRVEIDAPTRRIRRIDLITPLFEHGLTAILYIGGGYWVYLAYNENLVGFLGLVMMLWGGLFKGIVLIGIYGFGLYALLFRRDWFAHVAEARHLRRVNTRIVRDLERGQVNRAMDRMHGLLCAYPDNLTLRRRLAVHLIAEDRHAEAGRHLVLASKPSPEELQAIAAFCGANGHDPFQILRKAIRGLHGPDLPAYARHKLRALHTAITREVDQASRLYRNVDRYLSESERSIMFRFWNEYRTTLIELAVLAVLLVGLYGLKSWS